LFVAAGPSLPAFFNDAIHGLPVGFGNGSCGKAVTSNSRVIAEDISTEPQCPSVAYMALLDQAASLAGIAVEQARGAEALRVGEARFRSLYDHAPVALWQQDWSAVRSALQELAESGVEDVAQWLQFNPSHLHRLASLVRITDANSAALAQVGADPANKELSRLGLAQNFAPSAMAIFGRALLAMQEGAHLFQAEGSFLRLD